MYQLKRINLVLAITLAMSTFLMSSVLQAEQQLPNRSDRVEAVKKNEFSVRVPKKATAKSIEESLRKELRKRGYKPRNERERRQTDATISENARKAAKLASRPGNGAQKIITDVTQPAGSAIHQTRF